MTDLKSNGKLEKILAKGEFAVTGELGPPKHTDPEVIRKNAGFLKQAVDAANITDNQTAIVRIASLAGSAILLQEGLEPVMQMTVRDRNRIAMQSDVLGAAALGVPNILCLSGDHQTLGSHPGSKGVWDLDSMQLIQMVKTMRDDAKFLNGDEIKVPPKVYIGAVWSPFSEPLDIRIPRLAKKVAAGTDFVQTQGIFNLERFADIMKEVRKTGLHEKTKILAGVIPVKSVGAARYMQKNVSGVDVPEEIVQRLKGAEDPAQEGIKLAQDLIKGIREIEGVAGVHVMAIMWEQKVPEIVEGAGLLPRPEV
ncbi:MAG: methylenetetrahydrofolate reductase [Thermoplasmata archaeon]|nr:methylenetetrahydrofolate reductase [Thermoplasmata archaeon]